MFTSFNSQILYTAHSLPEQGALRQLLEAAGIVYSVSAIDPNAPQGFFPALSPELLLTRSIDYVFLVYKKDFATAAEVLKAQWHWSEEVSTEDEA